MPKKTDKKKEKKESKLTSINLTQYLEPEYWPEPYADILKKTNELLNAGKSAEATQTLMSYIKDRFNSMPDKTYENVEEPDGNDNGRDYQYIKHFRIGAIYGIIHDKDSREVWDEKAGRKVLEYKPPHLHAVIRFTAPKKKMKGLSLPTLTDVATEIGIEPQYLEKLKSGRYGLPNSLSYLIHAKDISKYQYDVNEVVTIRGNQYEGEDAYDSYRTIYENNKKSWENGRAKKTLTKAVTETADSLYEKVLMGEITKGEILLTDEYYRVYASSKRKFEDAFSALAERKYMEALRDLEDGKFSIRVLYIQGNTGAGKSTLAKKLAGQAITSANENGEKWSVHFSGATNPLDDYNGEEVLVMDDVRGGTLGANEWLRLFDPHNANRIGARYRNKAVVSRVIIVTSIQSLDEFIMDARANTKQSVTDEPADQFLRRIFASIRVILADDDMSKNGIDAKHVYLLDNYGEKDRFTGEYGIVKQRAFDTVEELYQGIMNPQTNGLDYDEVIDHLINIEVSHDQKQDTAVNVWDPSWSPSESHPGE